jgi:hypothetical protein
MITKQFNDSYIAEFTKILCPADVHQAYLSTKKLPVAYWESIYNMATCLGLDVSDQVEAMNLTLREQPGLDPVPQIAIVSLDKTIDSLKLFDKLVAHSNRVGVPCGLSGNMLSEFETQMAECRLIIEAD